jgi:hypothetical protein
MLVINSRNSKLATARADFLSRGMLHGTCLGEALHNSLSTDASNPNDPDEFSSPDGNGEGGYDLDLDNDEGEDNGSPGPVDGPPIFSEVILAQKKGSFNACSEILANKFPP